MNVAAEKIDENGAFGCAEVAQTRNQPITKRLNDICVQFVDQPDDHLKSAVVFVSAFW